ncbi:transglycosylase SLT domain-containing protein [Tepidamorphus sp. 3E244]|uniref:transglycosylase SLT domain-containing protein n=1 Tax=Tepidamorphus sp. 3E244 TaxID=3385498 RepID=UPI0038FC3C05
MLGTRLSGRLATIAIRRNASRHSMKIAAQQTISDRVLSALSNASERTGIGFDYLVKTAQRESAFDPSAKARTSSATGLFQFIESTWFGVMRENGERFGLNEEAAAIQSTGRGRFRVSDPDMRSHILSLRSDPNVAALMAGAFTEDNAEYLEKAIGREPNGGELYIAHFLGAGGAAKLINLAETRPNDVAANHFPAAAKANRPIFYKRGVARSVEDVYANLIAKHDKTSTPAVAAHPGASSPKLIEIAETGGTRPVVPASKGQAGFFNGMFKPGDTSGLTPAAQTGIDTMSLFATPAGSASMPIVETPVSKSASVEAAEAAPGQIRMEAVASIRRTQRGASDAAAIDTGMGGRSRAIETPARSQPQAPVAAAKPANPGGFTSFLNGIATFFGLSRSA